MRPRTPEEYWTPAIGHHLHLRPCDMADLTLEQLEECRKAIEILTGDG